MRFYTKTTQVSAVQCTAEWFASGADLAALSGVKGAMLYQDVIIVPDGNNYALSLRRGDWLVRDEQGVLRVVNDAEFRANYQAKDALAPTDLADLNEGDVVRETFPGGHVVDTKLVKRTASGWRGEVVASTSPAYAPGDTNLILNDDVFTVVSRGPRP